MVKSLDFTIEPVNIAAGGVSASWVAVRALDGDGNPAEGFTGTVSLALHGGNSGAALLGVSQVAAVGGLARFSAVTVGKAGTAYHLVARASGLDSAESSAFNVVPGPATRLAFVTGPSSGMATVALTPAVVIEARDTFANRVATFTGAITLTFGANTTGAALGGAGPVAAVAGQAAFPALTVSKGGAGYTLLANAAGFSTATSASFSMAAAPAVRLEFATQPADTEQGAPIPAFSVVARDGTSQAVTAFQGLVTLTLITTDTAAHLRGQVTVPPVAGTASFTGATVSRSGTGFQLVATTPGLDPDTSAAFGIAAPYFTAVAVGETHACGLARSGSVWCWGQATSGKLGDGSGQPTTRPVRVQSAVSFKAVSLGQETSCALSQAGAVYCWGMRLDVPGGASDQLPRLISSTPAFDSISLGWYHLCGLTAAGQIYCLGYNNYGQLGTGDLGFQGAPVLVQGGQSFKHLDAGGIATCAVTVASDGYCWGELFSTSGPSEVATPALVPGAVQWKSIDPTYELTCGVAQSGAAYCWGGSAQGALGDSTTHDTITVVPTPVAGGVEFNSVAVGTSVSSLIQNQSCGIATNGTGNCWGENSAGALGDASQADRNYPAPVVGGYQFASLEISSSPSNGTHRTVCATTTTGQIYCWGNGVPGTLGNGGTSDSSIPVLVTP